MPMLKKRIDLFFISFSPLPKVISILPFLSLYFQFITKTIQEFLFMIFQAINYLTIANLTYT